jgi:hypothetical protein
MTGTAKITFEFDDKNDDGLLVPDEIDVVMTDSSDMTTSTSLANFVNDMESLAFGGTYNLFQIHHAKTKEVRAGYLMTLKPVLDCVEGEWLPYKTMEIKVSKDYRMLEVEVKGVENVKFNMTRKHRKVGDKWLFTGFERDIIIAGYGKNSFDREDTFEIRDGIPFLKSAIQIEKLPTLMGVVEVVQAFEFSNWQIIKRDEELGIPEPAN